MPTTASMRATKKAIVRLVRAPADACPQVLTDGVGTPDKAVLPGGDVAVLDAGHRVHGAQVRVCLTGQVGLDEGKGNHDHQRDQQGHGELVLEKGTEGAAPVAVVGAGGGFGLLLTEPAGVNSSSSGRFSQPVRRCA